MTIVAVFCVVGAGTLAYFSDTETSSGNTFTAGTLDLKVDEKDDPLPVKFNLGPLKPGDYATITYELKNTGNIDGYLDLENVIVTNAGGEFTEPEKEVDPSNEGNLGAALYVTVKIGETTVYSGSLDGFAGSHDCNILLAGGGTTNVVIDWELPGPTTGNEVQGDIAGLSITFELQQRAED
jgi:predicted ribosomally synthesized peptide with SipW-like signal peptide